jgi:hypothetical protein
MHSKMVLLKKKNRGQLLRASLVRALRQSKAWYPPKSLDISVDIKSKKNERKQSTFTLQDVRSVPDIA